MIKNIYLKLIALFLVIEFLGITALYYYNYTIFKSTVINFESTFTNSYNQLQKTFIRNSIYEAKKNLENIVNTNSFTDKSDENILKIQQLFYDLTSTRTDILQMRYIDDNGIEIIKVQKFDEEITAISKNGKFLQNKNLREYFQETIKLTRDEFFISNFDLNIEFNEIEYPYKPTLRVSTPIVYEGENIGILVININMIRYLEIFENLENFNVYLVDKNGNYLLHPSKDRNWSSVLNLGYNLNDDFDLNIAKEILKNDWFSKEFIYAYSLEDIFNNNQGLKIIFKIKEDYLEDSLFDKNLKFLNIIILFNVVLGSLYFIFYSQITNRLKKEIIKNDENNKILDKYVATTVTNDKGEMIYVSDAFCQLTGYNKKELIGQNHSIMKSPKENEDIYKELWGTITKGDIWVGEIQNRKKNGQTYWIELSIFPKKNPNNSQIEYLSISNNITDKKLIEKLANTDHLTNLANRKKMNKEIENSIYNVNRYGSNYSLMIIDIDYFKDVNDTYGHNVGDSVLVEVARILEENTRKTDFVGRWGGEEFILITTNTTVDSCYSLAVHINKVIAKHTFEYVGNKTVSIGISQIYGNDTIESCVERADKNLYKAKDSGRNRVIV